MPSEKPTPRSRAGPPAPAPADTTTPRASARPSQAGVAPATWFGAPPLLWATLVLFGATFLAFAPALRAGFIWDDEAHVTAPALRSLHGLWRIWSERGATQQYYPLLHTAFWIEHRLWSDAALGYHLANLVFHATAACLVVAILRRLAVPGAFFAALIFALHPVQVESVAWISEQKNTLSAVFYLAAALVYLRFDSERRPALYALAFFLFVLGIATKTVTATLPAALLVVFWWERGRLSWRRDVAPLVPWFALGAFAGLLTAWIERHAIGASGAAYDLSLLQRTLLAGHVVVFYLAKLIWPADLTFIYPRWTIDPANAGDWLPLAGAFALGALLFWLARKKSRAPVAAFLFFAGSLFPVLGFFNVYPFVYSFVADHFQYLASLGVIALASAGLARASVASRHFAYAAGGLLALMLGAMTWRQCEIYRSRETLFRATVARNPACWMAWNNLGKELLADRSRLPEAIADFERALDFRPDYPEALTNLGLALTQSGRPLEAIPRLERSLALEPDSFQAHNNLGIALAGSGRAEDALASFEHAARLNPTLPNIHENIAKALLLLGRNGEAAKEFERAAQLRAAPLPSAADR